MNNATEIEQATPAQYPGIIPEKMDGDVFLFNLREDISEMNNVSASNPEIVKTMNEEFERFRASLKK